ncbi:unnamed protein product [Symbiodinium sp. CCMP2592]|nr:unnamed protein product [Symbiodinium sp. CCMP2592]
MSTGRAPAFDAAAALAAAEAQAAADFAAAAGLDWAHVFITNFAAGASDGELAAAVGALSAVDLARLMAACTAAQPTAGPSTPAISSPSSASGTLPPTGTTLSTTPTPCPPLSASTTAPSGGLPAEAWLAPPGPLPSVVPGPSVPEARQFWSDQEAASHHVDASAGAVPVDAAALPVPEDGEDDLEDGTGHTGLDGYLAGFPAPPPPLVVEPATGADDQAPHQRQPSGLFGSAAPSPAAVPAVEEPTPYERQRRAINQENALRALAGMGPMGFDVTYDEMLQLRIQRELREMATPPPPAKPAGQRAPEVIVPQEGVDPERDHPVFGLRGRAAQWPWRPRDQKQVPSSPRRHARHAQGAVGPLQADEAPSWGGLFRLRAAARPRRTVAGIFVRSLPEGVQGGKLPREPPQDGTHYIGWCFAKCPGPWFRPVSAARCPYVTGRPHSHHNCARCAPDSPGERDR